jgi:hypothetical protein
MHHSVRLSEKAFRAYDRLARRAGMSVEQYLDRFAPGADGFVLTPEMREGIERGLAQLDLGEAVSIAQVRESLAKYQAEWRKESR